MPVSHAHGGISPSTAVMAIGLLAASFLALHGLNRVTFDFELLRIGEQTLWTWVTSILFAASALAAAAFTSLQGPGRRWPWAAVAGLMFALSADEIMAIHERLEADGGSQLSFFLIQPLIAIAAVALFVRLMRALGRDARVWAALAAGALVLAQVGSTLSAEAQLPNAVNVGQAIAEELLEMLVPAFILAATLPALWPRLVAALELEPLDRGRGRLDAVETSRVTRS